MSSKQLLERVKYSLLKNSGSPTTRPILSEMCEKSGENMGKSKFVLWWPSYYNLLSEKKDKKNHAFEVPFFLFFLKW